MPLRRTLLFGLLAATCALAFGATSHAHAAVGDLTQKSGTAGCIALEVAPIPGCATSGSIFGPMGAVVSPDGRNVYVASIDSGSISIFDRNPVTGSLIQKPGQAGCIKDSPTEEDCANGRAMDRVTSVAISPDGKNVYATAFASNSVAIFDRDPNSGSLVQKAGGAGCIAYPGGGESCTHALMKGPHSVVVSPDGLNVYVAAEGSDLAPDQVAIFDRNPNTGTLTQKADEEGCIGNTDTDSCAEGYALDVPNAVAVSADGGSVYVTSNDSLNGRSALSIFDRDPNTGSLEQKSGTAGCISHDGNEGNCAIAPELHGPVSIAVSPDSKNVYAVSVYSNALSIFNRDLSTGSLTQKSGTDGCISNDGEGGQCKVGKALDFPAWVSISSDGRSVYVATDISGGLAIFDRDLASGSLTQKPGTDGCITYDGSGSQCQLGVALENTTSVTVSPDGTDVYAASFNRNSLTVFDRDYLAPDTTITSGPAEGATIAEGSVGFEFSSDQAGSSFECRLDGGAFTACASPHTIGPLTVGNHTFEVRAVHPRGKADPSPASRGFTLATDGGSGPGDGPGSGEGSVPEGVDRSALRIQSTAKMNRKGLIQLRLSCAEQASGEACRGKLKVVSKRPLPVTKQKAKGGAKGKRTRVKKRIALVRPKAFRVAAGKSMVLRLRLRAQARRTLARQIRRGKTIPAIALADRAGSAPTLRRQIRIVPPKRSKKKARGKQRSRASSLVALASTQRINLGRGRIAAPAGTWKATAVPRGDILVDLFDRSGSLRQTYGGRFERSFRARQMETSGMRPQGMPSRQAILVGATGLAIRKVRIHIRGGGRKVVRTVRSPADWGIRNRLFAVVFNVRAAHRNTLIAATKIEGLNARGRVIKTNRGRALNFGNY